MKKYLPPHGVTPYITYAVDIDDPQTGKYIYIYIICIVVDVGAPNLWGHIKNGVLKACDEVCGKKMGRRCKLDTSWWNEVVKEVVSR